MIFWNDTQMVLISPSIYESVYFFYYGKNTLTHRFSSKKYTDSSTLPDLYFYFWKHLLSIDQKRVRIFVSEAFLNRFKQNKLDFKRCFITTHQSKNNSRNNELKPIEESPSIFAIT